MCCYKENSFDDTKQPRRVPQYSNGVAVSINRFNVQFPTHHSEPWILYHSPSNKKTFHSPSSFSFQPSQSSFPLLFQMFPVLHQHSATATASTIARAQKTLSCQPTFPDCQALKLAGRSAGRSRSASSSPSTTSRPTRSTPAPASSSPPARQGERARAGGFQVQEIALHLELLSPWQSTSGVCNSYFVQRDKRRASVPCNRTTSSSPIKNVFKESFHLLNGVFSVSQYSQVKFPVVGSTFLRSTFSQTGL